MRPIYDLGSVFADQIRTAEEEAGRVYEAVIGLVTDNKDPDKLGRVQIKIPVLSDQDHTWWAPIIMLGAGKNRGWFFIPEPDDEVLVLFEHGDVNRPLVVGALWNGKDKPPDKNPGGNPRRVIKSRAGSKITFDDDQLRLVIEDGGGKGRITFDAASNKITFEALADDVCLQAPAGDMQLVAKSARFEAKNEVQVHAGSDLRCDAASSSKIGSSKITLSGSTVDLDSGKSPAATGPTAKPEDVPHPYSS
jgi:uncharacterized protein involved in type VI secretion and phage assembly